MPKIPCAVVSGNRKIFSSDSGMLFLCRGLFGGAQGVVLHDGAGGIQTGAQTQGQGRARTAGRHVQTQDAPGPEGHPGNLLFPEPNLQSDKKHPTKVYLEFSPLFVSGFVERCTILGGSFKIFVCKKLMWINA